MYIFLQMLKFFFEGFFCFVLFAFVFTLWFLDFLLYCWENTHKNVFYFPLTFYVDSLSLHNYFYKDIKNH